MSSFWYDPPAAKPVPPDHPLVSFLRRLTFGCFSSAGLDDREIAEYVTGVLVDFVRIDRLFKLTDSHGRRLEYLFEVIQAAEESGEAGRRQAYKHMGDYALFMTGFFPEHLERVRRPVSCSYYIEQGKNSYAKLASIDPWEPAAPLFRKLSDLFEECVAGLRLEQLYLRDPFYQQLLRQLRF